MLKITTTFIIIMGFAFSSYASCMADTTTAPDLALVDAHGNTITISALKGKVVFINFWATWCQPCVKEMPTINDLQASFKDVVFITVDIDSTFEKSNAYMAKNKYNLPVYAAPARVPREYYYHTIPATDILNKNGEIVWRTDGGFDYSSPEVKKILADLIESK